MTSLSKISSCIDKEWEIFSGWCFLLHSAEKSTMCFRAQIPAPGSLTRAGSQHRVFMFFRLRGPFLALQIALCMEYYIPPGKHVALGSLLRANHVTTA